MKIFIFLAVEKIYSRKIALGRAMFSSFGS
jgi:hypothetical protein